MSRLRSAALLLIFAAPAAPVLADEISIRADPYCPFNCEPGSANPGYMIDIAKAVFEPAGHKVDYQSLNWARAIVEARQGKYVAIVGGLKSDAPDFVYPDIPVGASQSCFFTKKGGTWSYKDVESLKAVSLGVVKDYSFGETIDPYIKANAADAKKIDYVSGDSAMDLNVKKLLAGRIGAILDDSAVVGFFLKSKGQSEVVRNAGCDTAKEIYIGFSPKNPKSKDYATLLTSGLKKLRESGQLAKIMDKYGLKDWAK